MTIHSKMVMNIPDVWYDPKFRSVLEDHLSFLKVNGNSDILPVDTHPLVKYRFDMFSFFRHYNIPTEAHWVTMRLNGFYSETDDFSDIQFLIVPKMDVLQQILHHFKSRNRK